MLAASLLLLAVLHATVSVETHPSHVIHVILRGLYLFPIIAAALWFGIAGGLLTAVGVSASYLVHILVSWRGQTMENVNQFAMIGVYLAVGGVSGLLVRAREREHAMRIAGERRAERTALIEGIAGLVAALGFRDDYTRQHCERVSQLAVAIGKRFDLSAERLETLRLAALTHDIGKIGVPDDILYKPEALSQAERARIERHPRIASEILSRIHGARNIAEIVLCHHECPDGSGYPRGLLAEQIPLEARILRVADVYAALTDTRVYRPGLGSDQALDLMADWGQGKLDEESLRALRSLGAADLTNQRPILESEANHARHER
ncbi:MAG: HD domain-containing phosphohydrolase [Thermoanaerobaculia bacterium]